MKAIRFDHHGEALKVSKHSSDTPTMTEGLKYLFAGVPRVAADVERCETCNVGV
jgi:hypothetical protein